MLANVESAPRGEPSAAAAKIGNDQRRPHPYLPYIGLLALGVLARGLILLNDGVFWDGWTIYQVLKHKDWTILYQFLLDGGMPMIAYFEWVLALYPNIVFSFHFVAFTSLILTAMLIYKICVMTQWLTSDECFWVAALSLCYPAQQVSFEIVIVPYVFCHFLFFLAFYLAMISESRTGYQHWLYRLVSLAFFLLSFTLNSLMAFYAIPFLMIYLLYLERTGTRWVIGSFRFLLWHIDYLMLPIGYWVLKKVLWPLGGWFARNSYNTIDLNPHAIKATILRFIDNSVVVQFKQSILQLIDSPAIVVVMVLALIWVIWRSTAMLDDQPANRLRKIMLLVAGMVVFFFGVLPYALVGKSPTAAGVETRHAILIGLPIAVMLVFTVKAVVGAHTRISNAMLLMLLFGFIAADLKNDIGWNVRAIKDRAIISYLSDHPEHKQYSVFWIEDRFPVGGDIGYGFYEWSGMFREAFGQRAHIGLDKTGYSEKFLLDGSEFFTKIYSLDQLDAKGRQAHMIVSPGEAADTSWRTIAKYTYYRAVCPAEIPALLKAFVKVEIEPKPSRPQ